MQSLCIHRIFSSLFPLEMRKILSERAAAVPLRAWLTHWFIPWTVIVQKRLEEGGSRMWFQLLVALYWTIGYSSPQTCPQMWNSWICPQRVFEVKEVPSGSHFQLSRWFLSWVVLHKTALSRVRPSPCEHVVWNEGASVHLHPPLSSAHSLVHFSNGDFPLSAGSSFSFASFVYFLHLLCYRKRPL